MLYIFHVDTGTTITFDIKLALQSVSELKEAIERERGVGVAHQVLLMSGGDSLESTARVCSYSAGTDTNPIYLFSKASIESQTPPQPSLDYGSDFDLQPQVDASLSMPATYQTLVARAQLAQQCCVLAREQTRICERLVHDQHLQQQGWAAVVANLEDITQTFQTRAEVLQQTFADYLSERQQHMELLANFNTDLSTLSKIPILPALRAHAEGLLSPEDLDEQEAAELAAAEAVNATNALALPGQESEESPSPLSLLRWISAKDNQSSLEQVADMCSRGLDQFDERVMESLKNEVASAIEGANKQEMKDIKGLGERLFALEQLMVQTKKLVQEQNELAQGFQQNQKRVSNLNDDSVLPDLCTSHRRQLIVMLQNHNQLRDIRRRCTKAKEELSVNIHRRLKWIMYVENKMMEVDSKLVMYHESLRRLRRQLEILRQIHLAPQMYLSAITEVVRRRTFSQAFLVWASNLACQLLSVHSEEIERRREFHSKFEGHFLNTLFPGLEDLPPPFATQAPSVFDKGLPKLTAEDMESLRRQLPDLAGSVSTPDLSSITQFFFSKSLTESSSDGNKGKESTSMPVDESLKEQEGARPPLISDRGGFESETDTEEFEKIGQAALDSKLASFESGKQQQSQQLLQEQEAARAKQLEVGASISTSSSTSTNVSPLTRSFSSCSSELLHFPSLSTSERQPLSPLTECAEYAGGASPSPKSSPNQLPTTTVGGVCDGQQKKQRQRSGSDSSSPSVGGQQATVAGDFLGTEFYMDESLPSSLSEHPTDSQHQAIVSLLQENLGSTREEVERLRSVIRGLKSAAAETLQDLRHELKTLKEKALVDRAGVAKLLEDIGEALKLHTCAMREREQELTVDHELELSDLKKMLQSRDDELQTAQQSALDKKTEAGELNRLVVTMRQKFDDEQEDMKKLRALCGQLEERLEQAQEEKEAALKDANEARLSEVTGLRTSLDQCQEKMGEMVEKLAATEVEHQKALKEENDKLQMEFKIQLETIRGRFKLMAASTMERSPSDSSLEKIERADVIELVNHETILEQAKKDFEAEKEEAVRLAVESERSSLDQELQLARDIISKHKQDIELYQQRELGLLEECRQYKSTAERLSDAQSVICELEADKADLERKIAEAQEKLEQHESQTERDKLRRELEDDSLKMSQTNIELAESLPESPKDEVQVSESKKVRLEANSDLFNGRIDALEAENKRLSSELRTLRESKERIESKLEDLENDKVRLEVELVKERTKRRNMLAESLSSSSIASTSEGSRDKDMSASVAVVAEVASTSRVDVATSTERRREATSQTVRDKLTKSTTSLVQQAKIIFTSCNPGDVVLVLWDQLHRNYTVLQDSQTYYFLNSDCIGDLDLKFGADGCPIKLHAVAEVVEKEYCSAKKPENRYRVPQGTKFYRVRVKPLQRHATTSKGQ